MKRVHKKNKHAMVFCPDCNKVFSRKTVLRRHRRKCTGSTVEFKCPACKLEEPSAKRKRVQEKVFSRADALARHLKNQHGITWNLAMANACSTAAPTQYATEEDVSKADSRGFIEPDAPSYRRYKRRMTVEEELAEIEWYKLMEMREAEELRAMAAEAISRRMEFLERDARNARLGLPREKDTPVEQLEPFCRPSSPPPAPSEHFLEACADFLSRKRPRSIAEPKYPHEEVLFD